MNEIQAIKTPYHGVWFNSRLEARWAAFFDALGVEWIYEPERFKTAHYYTPDFKVKCYGTRGFGSARNFEKPFDLYVEVKGKMNKFDADKIEQFSQSYPILIVGNFPKPTSHQDVTDAAFLGSYEPMDDTDIYPFNYETIDGDHFGAFPSATKEGYFYLAGDEGSYINPADSVRTFNAYMAVNAHHFNIGITDIIQKPKESDYSLCGNFGNSYIFRNEYGDEISIYGKVISDLMINTPWMTFSSDELYALKLEGGL